MTVIECRSLAVQLAEELPLREIAAAYLAGAELSDLAEGYDVELPALAALLVQVGFLPVGSVVRRYWQREPIEAIAASRGVSERTIYRMLARYRVSRRGDC